LFNYFKKQKFQDIPLIDLDDLKKNTKIVVIDDVEDSFPIKGIQNFGFTVEHWDIIDSNKLKRLEHNEFDIVILDILGIVDTNELGNIDGIDILKSLKKSNPNQIIIAFSGSKYDVSKGEFWKLADGFMNKPIQLLNTKEKLEQIIKDNFSNEKLILRLQDLMKLQVENQSDYKKIEDYIVKTVKKQGTLDLTKIVRLGITDTSGVLTIVTSLITLYNKYSND